MLNFPLRNSHKSSRIKKQVRNTNWLKLRKTKKQGPIETLQCFLQSQTSFIHSSALEGLIHVLQDRRCSLSHNSIKCVLLHIKSNAMALLSNINKYMKFCLSYDNFKNLKMVWIHSTMVKLFWSFKKVEAFQLEPVKNES